MNMDKNKDSRACDSASAAARNDRQNADNQKVDSRIFTQTAQSLSPAPALSLRALKKGEAIHKATAQKVDSSVKADSRSDYSASAECMDSKETSANAERYPLFSKEAALCHAAAHAAARNDDKKADSRRNDQNLETPQAATPTPKERPSDSKISRLESTFDKTAQSAFDSQAAGGRIFLKKLRFACFDEKAGLCSLLCGDKTDGLSHKQKANSPLFRKKPTPKERPSDSKISRLESGLFKPRKEIRLGRLSTQRGEEIHDSSPKAESPQTNIPLIDLHPQYHAHKPELDSAIASVLHSQHFILGEHSQALESELASFVGRRFCITCSSGTSALLLALLALDIGAGDEVITPSFSFIAAAEMVAFLGAKPVFVDICPHTYTLDIAQVKHAISPRTRAIIPVSLFGQPYDVAGLESLAKPHAIPIIEDGAQSFGAAIVNPSGEQAERRSGSFGDLSITSFFPSKPLGGYGDGGAVFCDDETLATKLYALRNHGQASKYRHTMLGLNARLDELQCAILRVKLRHFASELHLREQVAARYCTLLAPLQKHLALPHIAPNRTSVFAQFCLRVKDSREDWVVDRHLPDLAQHNQSSSQAAQSGVAIHTKKVDSSVKADSRSDYSASAECMDCHAAAHAAARNDDKKVDFDKNSKILKTSQAAGFADDFLKKPASASPCTAIACFASFLKKHRLAPSGVPCFQGGGEGIYLGDNEQAPAAESSKSAAKPTPTPSPSDSKISRLESTFDKTAQSAFDSQAAGGRIFLKKLRFACFLKKLRFACFDEKAGLCSLLCGDKTDGLSHKQKANSPLFRKKPTPKERPSDSKISRLESGLFKPRKEIRLGRLSTQRGEEIHDSSPKAESPQQKMDSSTTITRTHIISALNARGIATAIHYPTPLHLQEVFSHLGYKKGDFPISEQIAQEIFSIPFSPYLTEATQEHIARVLREIFAQI